LGRVDRLIQAVPGVVVVVGHPLLQGFGRASGLAVAAHVDEVLNIDLEFAGSGGIGADPVGQDDKGFAGPPPFRGEVSSPEESINRSPQ
jgi:hypothetical protein